MAGATPPVRGEAQQPTCYFPDNTVCLFSPSQADISPHKRERGGGGGEGKQLWEKTLRSSQGE